MDVHTLVPPAAEPEHRHAEVIRTTARQVWSAESAVDMALRENALLTVSVLDGHRAAGLAPSVVQRALASVSTTLASLFQSRTTLLEAHAELRAVQERMGAGTVKLGGLNKDEHDGPREAGVWGLPFGDWMSNVVAHPSAGSGAG